MLLTAKEMETLCVLHGGTISETLTILRGAKEEPPERMTLIKSAIEKLSNMNDGEAVSLAFDPEE